MASLSSLTPEQQAEVSQVLKSQGLNMTMIAHMNATMKAELKEKIMNAYLAARTAKNDYAMKLYAAAICGVIAVFVLLKFTRAYSLRLDKSNPVLQPIVALTRLVRKQTLHYMPGFVSRGQFLIVLGWLALNAGFMVFLDGQSFSTSWIANRAGWLASANMIIVTFLAMKNTPLAILTQYSYERLNFLHRIVGYTILALTVVHAIAYTDYFLGDNQADKFSERHIIWGIVLGFAMLSTVLVGVFLKRANYEMFYIAHVGLFMLIAVAFALHQPYFNTILPMSLMTAGLWFSDRLLRVFKLVFNSFNNEAKLIPLSNGGTRIIMKKPLPGAHAGKHCYLWVPSIRVFQTHPFTIVSNNPLELVVSSQDGFTKQLHNFAVANPGVSIKASAQGPYGTMPNPTNYDKVVLISGGSGATFTHGLAEEIMDKMTVKSTQQVELIWAVRDYSQVLWFSDHLNNLLTHEKRRQFHLKVHVTNQETAPPSPASSNSSRFEMDGEKKGNRDLNLDFLPGRPDLAAYIKEAVSSLGADKSILIAACGTAPMLKTVRTASAESIRFSGGPSVELHCEQFGW